MKFGDIYEDEYDRSWWILFHKNINKNYGTYYYVSTEISTVSKWVKHLIRRHVIKKRRIKDDVLDIRYTRKYYLKEIR